MMIDFSAIKRVLLLESILPQTYSWLSEGGRRSEEAFVLWAGLFHSVEEFIVVSAIYPEQTAFQTDNGVGVHVSGEELFRVSKWLHEHRQALVAQVHSHPTRAYHSDTDDAFPMVTAVGQFSIVVPDFAKRATTDLAGCAAYRLDMKGKWVELGTDQVSSIFKVVKA